VRCIQDLQLHRRLDHFQLVRDRAADEPIASAGEVQHGDVAGRERTALVRLEGRPEPCCEHRWRGLADCVAEPVDEPVRRVVAGEEVPRGPRRRRAGDREPRERVEARAPPGDGPSMEGRDQHERDEVRRPLRGEPDRDGSGEGLAEQRVRPPCREPRAHRIDEVLVAGTGTCGEGNDDGLDGVGELRGERSEELPRAVEAGEEEEREGVGVHVGSTYPPSSPLVQTGAARAGISVRRPSAGRARNERPFRSAGGSTPGNRAVQPDRAALTAAAATAGCSRRRRSTG